MDVNDNNDLDLDDGDDSFKIGGAIKYLVVLVLGALFMTGLLYFGGFFGETQSCPECDECSELEDVDCPVCEDAECDECPEPECPKLTSQRCNELFG